MQGNRVRKDSPESQVPLWTPPTGNLSPLLVVRVSFVRSTRIYPLGPSDRSDTGNFDAPDHWAGPVGTPLVGGKDPDPRDRDRVERLTRGNRNERGRRGRVIFLGARVLHRLNPEGRGVEEILVWFRSLHRFLSEKGDESGKGPLLLPSKSPTTVPYVHPQTDRNKSSKTRFLSLYFCLHVIRFRGNVSPRGRASHLLRH